jgi:hypothetical protein
MDGENRCTRSETLRQLAKLGCRRMKKHGWRRAAETFALPSNNRRFLLISPLEGCVLEQAASLTGVVSDWNSLSRIQRRKFPVIPCSGVIREFTFKMLKTKSYKWLNRCKKGQKQGKISNSLIFALDCTPCVRHTLDPVRHRALAGLARSPDGGPLLRPAIGPPAQSHGDAQSRGVHSRAHCDIERGVTDFVSLHPN